MASEVLKWIERDFLPYPDTLFWQNGKIEKQVLVDKVQHYVMNFLKFSFHLAALPFGCLYSMARYAVSLIQGKKEDANPPISFADPIPNHFGFSTSMFQDSGLGTRYSPTKLKGVCDWNEWLNPKRIEGADNYERFFFDILKDPWDYISILKSQNVNAHRFSLEWAVIEPAAGKYDEEAIRLYRDFIRQLKDQGIEPYVTLHHFVCPKWFKDRGGFEKEENIKLFKKHALKMMELFPQVTYWMPFNEINVDAFQKCVRGVYPPGHTGDIAGAGRMMRNLLIAHCKIYKEAKEKCPGKQIGSTHQWLNFEPLNGNYLEQLICYFLSKITHYACYNFFKTGNFSLEIPGISNVQFAIPQKDFREHRGFSDFIGVQFYGYPRLMAGFNGGKEYPGFGIRNYMFLGTGLTFGSTCPEGGIAQSFGPGFYPESLDKCLTEAKELICLFPGKTIVITETGCDAKVWKFGNNNWTIDRGLQKRYFQRILPILERFKKDISGFFAWTFANGLEWERGDTPILHLGNMRKAKGKILKYEASPAADLLKDIFGEKLAKIREKKKVA